MGNCPIFCHHRFSCLCSTIENCMTRDSFFFHFNPLHETNLFFYIRHSFWLITAVIAGVCDMRIQIILQMWTKSSPICYTILAFKMMMSSILNCENVSPSFSLTQLNRFFFCWTMHIFGRWVWQNRLILVLYGWIILI